MNLKKLNNEEIENIYNEHMITDFSEDELKPLEVIQRLIKKGIYICYGFYDGEELSAYAFLVTSKSYLLIDYYAVCSVCRDMGIGSKFLNIIKEHFNNYNGIILEVEKIEDAPDEEEKIIRSRRINFYKRNGMIMTNISVLLFGVNFSIMCLCNTELSDLNIGEALINIYKEIVSSKLYSKYVKVSY